MNTYYKNFNFILIVLLAFFGSITVEAKTFKVDGFEFHILSYDDKTVELVSVITPENVVTVPSSIIIHDEPYAITAIAERAFTTNNKEITKIILPETVTNLGAYSFCGCSVLTSIILPKSLTIIGSNAFANCRALTSIKLPPSLKIIGDNAFSNCKSLSSLIIPENIEQIGYGAFSDCSNLNSVKLPGPLKILEHYLFYGCSALSKVELPQELEIIKSGVFEKCTSLSSIISPILLKNFPVLKNALLWNPLNCLQESLKSLRELLPAALLLKQLSCLLL